MFKYNILACINEFVRESTNSQKHYFNCISIITRSSSFLCCSVLHMHLKESLTSRNLLRATNDDIVNVVIACARNIKNALVAIRGWAASHFWQESDWANFIEESKLWLDFSWEADRRENALSLHEDVEAIRCHTSGVSEGVPVLAPILNTFSVSLVIFHWFGIAWREESTLRLDFHSLLTHNPLIVLLIFSLSL